MGVNFMNFKDKNREREEEEKEENNEIEIVIGDDSDLEISDVGVCMSNLRPKDHEKNKKEIVIPKTKNKTKGED